MISERFGSDSGRATDYMFRTAAHEASSVIRLFGEMLSLHTLQDRDRHVEFEYAHQRIAPTVVQREAPTVGCLYSHTDGSFLSRTILRISCRRSFRATIGMVNSNKTIVGQSSFHKIGLMRAVEW